MNTQQSHSAPSRPTSRPAPSRQSLAAAEAARQREIAAHFAGGGRRSELANVAILGYN